MKETLKQFPIREFSVLFLWKSKVTLTATTATWLKFLPGPIQEVVHRDKLEAIDCIRHSRSQKQMTGVNFSKATYQKSVSKLLLPKQIITVMCQIIARIPKKASRFVIQCGKVPTDSGCRRSFVSALPSLARQQTSFGVFFLFYEASERVIQIDSWILETITRCQC